MKSFCRHSALVLIFILSFNSIKAQYVTIPDTSFVSWLNANGYASCLNGNQLDTSCPALLSTINLFCYAVPIRDLTGVQYFKNLNELDCSNDSLYSIPALPANLTFLNCEYNNLSNLPPLPATLRDLYCDNNRITSLPALPQGVHYLSFGNNRVTNLTALPDSLTNFTCNNNLLTSLPALPSVLSYLICTKNQLTGLPALPSTLTVLFCDVNQIAGLPALPASHLNSVNCSNNLLTSLPAFPQGLQAMVCDYNRISSLPALPLSLKSLSCNYNQLTNLPSLTDSLSFLSCDHNQLSNLPVLPQSLYELNCGDNLLTYLPALPASLRAIECIADQLTSIPPLPDSLTYFYCDSNINLSCLPRLTAIGQFTFTATGINCLPDYGTVQNSNPPLTNYPLCGIFNSGGCQPYWNISGEVYYDANADCLFDSTDFGEGYVKMQLNSGGMQQQVYSSYGGGYSFIGANNTNYSIEPDTTNLPFIVRCPGAGYLNILLSAQDSFTSAGNNFALQCRTDGIDVGVRSIVANYGIPRPATNFTVNPVAGDMSELYGAHCAAGNSGQVELIYTGQATYHGAAAGGVTPTTVNGNTLTWLINDFGSINDYPAFNSMFSIDSGAIAGTQVCFTVHVTTSGNDYNPSNNTAYYCFTIEDALDPNEKEVSPVGNIDTSQQWLTYTIRFQNTGSAPAQNIRITDTLDSNLDPSTFQLTAFSAKNLTQLFGNAVVFNFPNINLPDSLTSDSASRGYVQYKIKLKGGLQPGTQIQNTADIYFDLNPAVVTNTTTNTISNTTDTKFVSGNNGELNINLFPNPATDYAILETDAMALGATIQISDVTGKEVMRQQVNSIKTRIPLSGLAQGMYVVKLSDGSGRCGVKKLVIE